MEKFATNKNGNIDSGTEVLANNMVFLQQAKANAISNLYNDLFTEGILNINMGSTSVVVNAFELKQGLVAGTFSVGLGIAYKKDVNTGLIERIAILEESDYVNEPFGDSTYPDGRGINQKTFDGVDAYIDTPKSSGCLNIPIPSVETIYYVDLRYVNVCDNGNDGTGLNLTNYSLAKNESVGSTNQRKRFYKWIDGYNIVLITNLAQQQGVILGTVQKDINNNITFTDTSRANDLLINSNIFMNYFIEGSGITVAEVDNKKMLSINVDDKTTEIENNKVRVTKDALYPYNKFTVNSGNKDINNEPDVLLTDSVGLTINFGVGTQTPLIVSPAYNDRYAILADDIITNISSVRDYININYGESEGTYTVCVNNTNKDNGEDLDNVQLELMKKVYISKNAPSTTKGDIWLDISVEPFRAKWFNGGSWIEYHGVPLGEVIVDSSTITVNSYNFSNQIQDQVKTKQCNIYNYNSANQVATINLDDNNFLSVQNVEGVLVNNTQVLRTPAYTSYNRVIEGADAQRSWTATQNGWIYFYSVPTINSHLRMQINSVVFWYVRYNWGSMPNLYMGPFPVKKGDVIVSEAANVYFLI